MAAFTAGYSGGQDHGAEVFVINEDFRKVWQCFFGSSYRQKHCQTFLKYLYILIG